MGDFTIREEVRSVLWGYELLPFPCTLVQVSQVLGSTRVLVLSRRKESGGFGSLSRKGKYELLAL